MALVADQSISVIFPSYNEEGNIEQAVDQAIHCLEPIFPGSWEIIVVNDGSQDRTGEIIDRITDNDPRVTAVHHAVNQGYGAALKSGFQKAKKELVFFCDSDLQFHISELLLCVTWIEQVDLVIGYRTKRSDPFHRKLNAWGWRRLVRLLLGLKVRDIDCAFKLFRASMFEHIKIDAVGAMVNTEILVQAVRMGFKIQEVPVTHFARQEGTQTGANLHVILKAFKELSTLYFKLRHVQPVVQHRDRRRDRHTDLGIANRRGKDRRHVVLPINISDRRHRTFTGAVAMHNGSRPDTARPPVARAVGSESGHTIAMVVASPFPANHGTPGSIKEMAEALATNGHRLHIVAYHFGEGPAPHDIEIHRIADVGFNKKVVVGPTWQKPFLDLLMVFTLCRVILQTKADVIHAHNVEGALVGYIAKLVTGRPLVYNAINTMSDELPKYNVIRPRVLAIWLAKVLDYWVPRMADHILCLSQEIAQFLLAKGIPADRIHVVPLGVDGAQFEGADRDVVRRQYNLNGQPLVVYAGILDPLQRIDYLLKAMSVVVQRKKNARLMLVSNLAKQEDLDRCNASIRELGLEGTVDIATRVAFEDLPPYLAAADVAVVSRPECPGFPVKLLNYMAAGKPIVVFEGSSKGLQHFHNAVVVDDHDWKAMGNGILAVLDDPELAGKLGRNAKQRACDDYSWSTIVAQLETTYAEVLRP